MAMLAMLFRPSGYGRLSSAFFIGNALDVPQIHKDHLLV